MDELKPAAWLYEPKVQRKPGRHLIRGCYTTEPTAEQLEVAELDGDKYSPLYDAATVDRLRREVESLRADAERLDAIESGSYSIERELEGDWEIRHPRRYGASVHVATSTTLRAAIDAARKAPHTKETT